MFSFLRFLSLTSATQICLAINQLILLPLQLRVWGQETTGVWCSVLAFANLASVADLGLRNSSHDVLLARIRNPHDKLSCDAFAKTWALARATILTVMLVLITAQCAISSIANSELALWMPAIIVAIALDAIFVTRGVWLDTVGHFNRVEAVFLILLVSRLVFSIGALAAFKASPSVLTLIMILTAAVGLWSQSLLIAVPPSLRLMARGFEKIRWTDLLVFRLTAAEPMANWVRLNLPVLVIAAHAPGIAVATYVGVRALFGAGRQVINQIARYASVGYVQRLSNPSKAHDFAIRFLFLSSSIATLLTATVLADNGRLAVIWLHGSNGELIGEIARSFAIGASAYTYQVIAGILIRMGDIESVARRNYVYLLAGFANAALAFASGSVGTYLVLIGLQELFLGFFFFSALGTRVFRAAFASFIASLISIFLIATVEKFRLPGIMEVFNDQSAYAVAVSLAFAVATVAIFHILAWLNLKQRRASRAISLQDRQA